MEVVACSHQACEVIAMSMAYSLYLQCDNSTVDPESEWMVTPVSGPRFPQRMSLQMVQYKCSNLHYPGDEKMRKNTQMKKRTIELAKLVLSNVCVFLASGYGWGTVVHEIPISSSTIR
jgi:hypothetical protein